MCHYIHVAVNTWLNCSFFTLIVIAAVDSLLSRLGTLDVYLIVYIIHLR